MQRKSRKGALVSYHKAIDFIVRRAIPADSSNDSVRLLADLYEVDVETVVDDMKKRLEPLIKRNNVL